MLHRSRAWSAWKNGIGESGISTERAGRTGFSVIRFSRRKGQESDSWTTSKEQKDKRMRVFIKVHCKRAWWRGLAREFFLHFRPAHPTCFSLMSIQVWKGELPCIIIIQIKGTNRNRPCCPKFWVFPVLEEETRTAVGGKGPWKNSAQHIKR